jgi:hypothetical protein
MMEYLYTSTYTTQSQPPDFALPVHIKVFVLASMLEIPGLQTLACNSFSNNLNGGVTDLEVYFSAVKEAYAYTTYANPALRLVVVEAAITEMRVLLGTEAVKKRFHSITQEVPDFQVRTVHLFRILFSEHDFPESEVSPNLTNLNC